MKFIIASFLAIFSASSFAAFNEIECEGKFENKELFLEVERPFPSSSFLRGHLTVRENNDVKYFDYSLSASRIGGFYNLRLYGAGLRLDIDTWPDQSPRWGRDYRASLLSREIAAKEVKLECTFPNIW